MAGYDEDNHKLTEQCLDALWALLAGLQEDAKSCSEFLEGGYLGHVSSGLLAILLRLTFLLHAEARGLVDGHPVQDLYTRLQNDAAHDGAWAHLRALLQRVPILDGALPDVSDDSVLPVLQHLMVHTETRQPIAYQDVDIDHLGFAYEAVMGFEVHRAPGISIALKPRHVVVNLGELLRTAPTKRSAWLVKNADCKLTATERTVLKAAKHVDALVSVLDRKRSPRTPTPLAEGSLYLQPGAEQRRSGSHYTPRDLTVPIIGTALRPVLEKLGDEPTPAQLLALTVCDPAMGAGAFLLEACRQLAEHLTRAGKDHGTPVTEARRLVAQRCLYGVDKNPVAVQLAKLSLWLMVGSSRLPFSFLDHALKHGDALVGLGRERIGEASIESARLKGDLLVSAFFAERTATSRAARQEECLGWWRAGELDKVRAAVAVLRKTVVPFHWEVVFPEVFQRQAPGFDVMVGNPPFLKGSAITGTLGTAYLAWLKRAYRGAGGQADLVAYFFQRAFSRLRPGGCMGLVGTQTIAQGATRSGSLEAIIGAGGTIYAAVRRIKWSRGASVTVSSVHIQKGRAGGCVLDGKPVERISAFLFSGGADTPPRALAANEGLAFMGYYPYGEGFLFDDRRADATPIRVMEALLSRKPAYRSVVRAYIGGEEFLADPTQQHRRYAICLGDLSESQARAAYPELMTILEEKVRPLREQNRRARLRKAWWKYGEPRPGLRAATQGCSRILMHPYVSSHVAFGFVPGDILIGSPHYAFALETYAAFACLQARPHELWARFFASSLEERLTYTASHCFDTLPFPEGWPTDPTLEAVGADYYAFRAALMRNNNEGLTKTYNRFHNPTCQDADIAELRARHIAMDRAVLHAYGWDDIPTDCAFRLDDDIDEEDCGRRKKPYRYRWPADVQDAVLARLLDLNQRRHAEEVERGLHDKTAHGKGS